MTSGGIAAIDDPEVIHQNYRVLERRLVRYPFAQILNGLEHARSRAIGSGLASYLGF